MPLWQRLVVTLLAMAAASLIVGLIWQALFGLELPSYIAGVVGGITAVPTWEFLTDSAQRGCDPAQEHGPGSAVTCFNGRARAYFRDATWLVSWKGGIVLSGRGADELVEADVRRYVTV